jgi:glycosylphosphatidylinositol transamidase (GPIT) subunit GPI8
VLSVCAVILAADDHPSSHTNNWAVLVRDDNIITYDHRYLIYLWYDPRPILCLKLMLGRGRELVLILISTQSDHNFSSSIIACVQVCSSRYWFNYRHVANTLSIYRSVKRLGIPDR